MVRSVRAVEKILGAFASPDGRWRVLAMRDGARAWYRILRDGQVFADGLTRGEAERLLRDARLHLADLVEEA
jgi:bifunctional non-homologous end joining protein LigD